jgi:hypothetical protein
VCLFRSVYFTLKRYIDSKRKEKIFLRLGVFAGGLIIEMRIL